MKPAKFEYERPDDFATALRLLSANSQAKLLAGGQSLGPMMNFRVATPSQLIDISRLQELKRIEDSQDEIRVGAATCHSDFEDGRVPSPIEGLFPRVALGISYRAVRNRGTIGGSLAHADPAADWPGVMTTLGAKVIVRSVRGTRTVEAGDLPTSPLETSLDSAKRHVSAGTKSTRSRGSLPKPARWSCTTLSEISPGWSLQVQGCFQRCSLDRATLSTASYAANSLTYRRLSLPIWRTTNYLTSNGNSASQVLYAPQLR
jgi:FAD binding domain in molybdopterin dehydrogenase